MRSIAIAILSAAVLSGCSNTGGYKQPAGALLGGVGGAVAGAQFGSGTGQLATTGAGALLGALIGSEAGASLDRADQAHYSQRIPQQVPNPYFGYAPRPYYGAPRALPRAYVPRYGNWTASNCQALMSNDPFAPANYACQAPNGGWFISQ